MKNFRQIILIATLTLLSSNHLFSQIGEKDFFSVKPDQLYPEMIDAVKIGDWNKLNNAIDLLNPLSKEIKKYLKAGFTSESTLRTAIKNKDKDKTKQAIKQYIMDSIDANLKVAHNAKNGCKTRKEAVRQAFSESKILDLFRTSAEITKANDKFKKIYDTMKCN